MDVLIIHLERSSWRVSQCEPNFCLPIIHACFEILYKEIHGAFWAFYHEIPRTLLLMVWFGDRHIEITWETQQCRASGSLMFCWIRNYTWYFGKHCAWRFLWQIHPKGRTEVCPGYCRIFGHTLWLCFHGLTAMRLIKQLGEVQICVGFEFSSLPWLWCMQLWHLQGTAPELLAVLRSQWDFVVDTSALLWTSSAELLLLPLWQRGTGAGEKENTVSLLVPRRPVFGTQSHLLPHRENGAIRCLACHLQRCFFLHPFLSSLLSQVLIPWLFAFMRITCYYLFLYFPVSLMSVLVMAHSNKHINIIVLFSSKQ